MSLYVFDIYLDHAVVSADSRVCAEANGTYYRIHDRAKKLRVVDGMIFTLGGVEWICRYMIDKFEGGNDHSIDALCTIVTDTVTNIDEIANAEGAPPANYADDPYLIELCCVHYDERFGHNVFYQIATSRQYQLVKINVDGAFQTHIRAYGGENNDEMCSYVKSHQTDFERDYCKALQEAYSALSSEKIGGTLTVCMLDRNKIGLSNFKIKDLRPVKKYDICFCGRSIVTDSLLIESGSEIAGVKQFRFDELGARINNGTLTLSKDGGGQILLDPRHGIVGGKQGIFALKDKDVIPSFVDVDGNIKLDADGMPEGCNFFLDLRDGTPYFRGTVHATGGDFSDGEVIGSVIKGGQIYIGGKATADDCVFGVDALGHIKGLETANGKLKFDADGKAYFDNDVSISGDLALTGGINIGGNIDFSGAGSITWGSKTPVKYQFSATSVTGPWHDTMQTNDKYRRDSLDGGTTWGAGYQFVGKDGQDGADGDPATVPKYITDTVIAKGVIEAPRINANVFSVYPKYSTDYTGAFNIYGQQMSDQYHMFTINYKGFSDPTYPYVELYSPDGANMYLCANTSSGGIPSGILTIGTLNGKAKTYHITEFYGDVDFSNANVSGATFVLA